MKIDKAKTFSKDIKLNKDQLMIAIPTQARQRNTEEEVVEDNVNGDEASF